MLRLYLDAAYPSDPAEAEGEAVSYWLAADCPWERAAFAAIVARRIAEIARDGLKGECK